MDLGPHAIFIWLSYAAVMLVLGLLLLGLWLEGRRQARALADLEQRGLARSVGAGAPGSEA